MASKAGGGINSRQVTKQGVKTGQNARAMNPRGVSQIGSSIGSHATNNGKKLTKGVEPVRGAMKPSGRPGGVPLGNECALRGTGVGADRTLYGQSGTQGQHGPVAGQARPASRGFDERPNLKGY
jgi:hypothetical protein